MVALWLPKEELKADLEDQARKRLEEIQREAEKRRNSPSWTAAQSEAERRAPPGRDPGPLQRDGRSLVRQGAAGAGGRIVRHTEDVPRRSAWWRRPAVHRPTNAPTLDALRRNPMEPPQMPGSSSLDGQTSPSQSPGSLGEPYTPPAEVPKTPPMDGAMDGMPSMFSAPGLGGLGGLSPRPAPPPPPSMDGMAGMMSASPTPGLPGGPPDEPPGFKPPGLDGLSGLGSALSDRMRGRGHG